MAGGRVWQVLEMGDLLVIGGVLLFFVVILYPNIPTWFRRLSYFVRNLALDAVDEAARLSRFVKAGARRLKLSGSTACTSEESPDR
ncbi:hypothetical protein CLV78_10268 [Aliiruegeria haliotis]|uniref:Uncharacterized protein n=2 Tax=Aliiruegeria haliotis TaxID=1280846 RepID=A0A2T0RUL5_9RHOB|nr:hypothetical protein CLV78_10268 [Aliiruegeria haliotis]